MMNFFKSSTGLFTFGFALIILTNIIVLMGVSSNRSGESTSHITLSERELKLPYRIRKENSGISLKIKWRVLNEKTYNLNSYNNKPHWLDKTKLQALGFDTQNQINKKDYKPSPSKEVFLVLEYDGEAYQNSLKSARDNLLEKESKGKVNDIKRAEKALHVEQTSASKLFVIDTGINYSTLRQKYNDTNKYIIAKGLVKSYFNKNKKEIYGYINSLSVTNLHVELKYKNLLSGIAKNESLKNTQNIGQKFKATINYGSRYEPWISDIKITEQENSHIDPYYNSKINIEKDTY